MKLKFQKHLRDKVKYFALYLEQSYEKTFYYKNIPSGSVKCKALTSQHLADVDIHNIKNIRNTIDIDLHNQLNIEDCEDKLLLKPISALTDVDFIKIATKCVNIFDEELHNWNIERKDDCISFKSKERDRILNELYDKTFSVYYDGEGNVLSERGQISHQNERLMFQILSEMGYAIPWMDMSVDDLIEIGWVKLI